MNHNTKNRPMNNIIYNRLLPGRMSFLEVCLLLMLPFLLLLIHLFSLYDVFRSYNNILPFFFCFVV